MKFSELPIRVQEQLKKDMIELKGKSYHNQHNIEFYNKFCTRYFVAVRDTWNKEKDKCCPYGGGSMWKIYYGIVGFEKYKHKEEIKYRLSNSIPFSKVKDYEIPRSVKTKKEVLEVVNKIGKFSECLKIRVNEKRYIDVR